MDFQSLPEGEQEKAYWPFRLIKDLGRYANMYSTFFAPGHTIPNQDPPRPYAEGVRPCCVLLAPPLEEGESFDKLSIHGTPVHFLQLVPITEPEMRFKMEHGMQGLLAGFGQRAPGAFIIDPSRPDVELDPHAGDNGEALDTEALAEALAETRVILERKRASMSSADFKKLMLSHTPTSISSCSNRPISSWESPAGFSLTTDCASNLR